MVGFFVFIEFNYLGVPAQKRQCRRAFHCNLLQEAGKRIFVTIPHAGFILSLKLKLRS